MTSKKYTLSVADVVEVPVKFTLKEGRVNKTFSFSLTATRLEQEDIAEKMQAVEYKFRDGLIGMGVITDWKDQRLVLDESGSPAEFSEDALDALLRVPMVAQIVYQAYLKECGAKEKN